MNKKVVWLPYDFDTALGINNEGALVFAYNLEDIDHLEGGADVFNGQESVVWNNIRDAFSSEIKEMYQQLRSQGKLSYDLVEQMFEAHQDKWGEAIFNEDAYFKYLAPLVAPDAGKEPTGAYLSMLQGSKREQRKWWLYNRFRYMDSKYNAGDALSDVVQLRGYAKANVSVTPYADVYASVKYGSYLVQARGQRNVSVTLPCPLDSVNDTEIYIYSASQLAAIGDISGLLVGYADFSMATKIQSLKIGEGGNYENRNLKELYLGANVLLKDLDVRNCPALGTDKQSTVDISGCTNIENVYFDGTSITGLTLPNGGVLKVLHLPATITNLTIMNQIGITDLTVASYQNISTLRLENVPTLDTKAILNNTPANARVRLIGFTWEAENASEIEALLDKLDTMRGLDEHGNNVEKAQVSGTIHTSALTGAEIASFNARYPYLHVTADHTSCTLNYYSYDGATLLESQTVLDGGDGTYAGQPARQSTAQYLYRFEGWSTEMDATTADANATKSVTTDRNVYAAYSRETRKYTATFVRASDDGGGTLYTQTNIPYGTVPTYSGSTPTTTKGDAQTFPFDGWTPALAGITGNTTYTAKFKDTRSKTRQLIQRTIKEAPHESVTTIGMYAFRTCRSLKTADFPNVTAISDEGFAQCDHLSTVNIPNLSHIGYRAFTNCSSLQTVYFPNASYVGEAAFAGCGSLQEINMPNITSLPLSAFYSCYSMTTASFQNVTSMSSYAFANCYALTTMSFPNASYIGDYAFSCCSALTTLDFPKASYIGKSAFYNCSRAVSVNFPEATVTGFGAFTGCKSISTVSFPKMVAVGTSAFHMCESLEAAYFNAVYRFSASAFGTCSALMSLYVLSNSVAIMENANALQSTPMSKSTYTGAYGSIYVPASLVSAYKSANNWSAYASRITAYEVE